VRVIVHAKENIQYAVTLGYDTKKSSHDLPLPRCQLFSYFHSSSPFANKTRFPWGGLIPPHGK
jgi:hypothetical protein